MPLKLIVFVLREKVVADAAVTVDGPELTLRLLVKRRRKSDFILPGSRIMTAPVPFLRARVQALSH